MGVLCCSSLSIIPDKSSRIRHGHEHERPPHRPSGARTAVFAGAGCSRHPVSPGGRSSVSVRRAVDPGSRGLLLQVTRLQEPEE